MKTLYALMFCLCAVFTYAQTEQPLPATDGTYIFQKGTFLIYNYGTQAEIDKYIINDPTSVDKTDMYFHNVFLEATINNGILSSCILPDNTDYTIKDVVELLPSKEYTKDDNINNSPSQLAPYSFSTKGNTLTFTIRYLYGDSRYNFPLEGKLTIDLTKQKY